MGVHPSHYVYLGLEPRHCGGKITVYQTHSVTTASVSHGVARCCRDGLAKLDLHRLINDNDTVCDNEIRETR